MKELGKVWRRAIITAIAITLCIGSTMAWFAIGSRARMNGMTVRISGGDTGGIVLATTGKGTYTDNLTISNETLNLNPCTTADGINFFTVSNGVSANGSTDGAVCGLSGTNTESVSGAEYINEFWIYAKSSTEAEYGSLIVSDIILTGDGAGDFINAALRVSVTYNGETKIYAPSESATAEYKSISAVTGNLVSISTNALGETFESGVTADYKQIIVRAWYEGQDESCTSENRASASGDVGITIEFAAE